MSTTKQPIERCVYPESEFGGFTRFDATIPFYARIHAIIPASAVVLDIGCGRGGAMDDPSAYRRNLRDLRGLGRNIIGIDVDSAGSSNPTIDEFRLITDPSHWPIEDATIDVGYCDCVVEHLENPDQFFAEWRRVLRPNGIACLRTPNSFSYVAIVSRILPSRFHARVANYAQNGRKAEDVFPTFYRCNTRRKLTRMFSRHGFRSSVYTIESEPNYLQFSRLAYRVGAYLHRVLPQSLQSTLVAFAQKHP